MAKSVVVVATSDRAGADARAGGHDGDRGGRIFSRPGQKRAADHGLAHAVCDRAARDRSGRRRAADDARLSAVACSRCCRSWSSAPGGPRAGASPPSTPCWSRATIRTSRSATPCAGCSTATSCCRAGWRRKPIGRPSTCWKASAGCLPTSRDPEQRAAAQTLRELLAAYRDHEDLISIGAYRQAPNPAGGRRDCDAGRDQSLPAAEDRRAVQRGNSPQRAVSACAAVPSRAKARADARSTTCCQQMTINY